MPNANMVVLMGHLARDPELKYVGNGKTAICQCSIATTKHWKEKGSGEKKEKTAFVDLTIWSGSGERFAEWFRKGSAVYVTGSLEQDTWEDKETGKKRSKLFVNVTDYQGVGGKNSSRDDGPGDDANPDDVPY